MIVIMIVNILISSIFIWAIWSPIFIIFFIFFWIIINNLVIDWPILLPFHHLDCFFEFVFSVDVFLRSKLKSIAYFLNIKYLNFSFRKLHWGKKQIICVKIQIVLSIQTYGNFHGWRNVADFLCTVDSESNEGVLGFDVAQDDTVDVASVDTNFYF